jgi:predicted metal-dependent enzyme (double-stranded beta helix superfamily)
MLNTLDELIEDIEENNDVSSSIKKYSGTDWKKYIKIDDEFYHRELVYRCEKFDVVIITWNVKQCSKIHNHPTSCYMKILHGCLNENVYIKQDQNLVQSFLFDIEPKHVIELLKTNVRHKDDIGFMNDSGLHSIENMSNDTVAVSLNIYTPSNFKTTYYSL